MMKILSSLDNPRIKKVRELHSKKGRTAHRQFIAEGLRVCQTLLEGPMQLVHLYCSETLYQTALSLISDENITVVNKQIMNKISTATTPSGIVAVFKIPQNPQGPLQAGLVLANCTDPGNMGTLIRTATAFAQQAIVIVEGTDPWAPKVVQATGGTIGKVPVWQMSWDELREQAHNQNSMLSALVVSEGTPVEKVAKKKRLLVVGNEAHGLPQEWIDDCDETITLPMPGDVESLNAAVAGSIALYLLSTK